MKGKIGDKQRLQHILEAISEIENYTDNTNIDTFFENSMMRFASIKQMEIIGEAANYLTEETTNKFFEIQWKQIIGLRNMLVHEYFGIDNDLIWQIISKDIPKLKIGVEEILTTL